MKILEAKRLLRNVKGEQFVSEKRFNEIHYGMGTYKRLSNILRATEKALFIADPQHPGDAKTGYWVPKSVIQFFLKSNKDNEVQITMKFNNSFTNTYKENSKASNGDSNSVWVSIFQGQDANGLTANGYALS